MATIAVQSFSTTSSHGAFAGARALLGPAIAGALPLGVFGLVNLVGEGFGVQPLFFAPYAIPGWLGAGVHLSLLFLMGAAAGLAFQRGGRDVMLWAAASCVGMIAFPFLAPWVDSLQLALYVVALLLLSAATAYRLWLHAPLAGILMLPVLAWLGIGAALGLTMAAAWSPPFALTQGNQQTPPPLA